MHALLTLSSSLVYFVLAASVVAFVPALISWGVLRWATGCPVPFNRAYYASLVWVFAGSAVALLLLLAGGRDAIDLARPLASPWVRAAALADLLLGAVVFWRMVPRGDGRRISLGNACLGAALAALPAIAALALLHR